MALTGIFAIYLVACYKIKADDVTICWAKERDGNWSEKARQLPCLCNPCATNSEQAQSAPH